MNIGELLEKFTLTDLPAVWHEHVWPMVRHNAEPPYYLVGGAITRTIINRLYGAGLPIRNYDTAVGELATAPTFSNGWVLKQNSYGNWKVVSEQLNVHVDVWPFYDWVRNENFCIQTIQDAVSTVPMNFQAVAYDIVNQRLHYHPAFAQSITDRCVRVLYRSQFELNCSIAKVEPEQNLKYRAERLGFRFEL